MKTEIKNAQQKRKTDGTLAKQKTNKECDEKKPNDRFFKYSVRRPYQKSSLTNAVLN